MLFNLKWFFFNLQAHHQKISEFIENVCGLFILERKFLQDLQERMSERIPLKIPLGFALECLPVHVFLWEFYQGFLQSFPLSFLQKFLHTFLDRFILKLVHGVFPRKPFKSTSLDSFSGSFGSFFQGLIQKLVHDFSNIFEGTSPRDFLWHYSKYF